MTPHFRSDELYFIRLAGGYIRSIFWDVFRSNNKNRPKKLYALIAKNFTGDNYTHLRESIVPDPNNYGWRKGQLDCISGTFKKLLEEMPNDMVEAFETTLRQNYGIFIRFKDDKGNPKTLTFVRAIETLYRRRNYLEHYNEKKIKYNERRDKCDVSYTDEEFIRALGLFLLPEILHHFTGRIASYEAKQGNATENATFIRSIATEIVKERRQNTYRLFSDERGRSNTKDKNKRKFLVDDMISWRIAYRQLTHQKTDYREHEFKLRFYFIGKDNIEKIRKILCRSNENMQVHFKRDIEAFYILTVDINLRIHRMLEDMKVDDKVKGTTADETQFLTDVRNTIAHNGFFWDVKSKDFPHDVYDVFNIFCGLLTACIHTLGRERANDMYVQIERVLRKENFAIADVAALPPQCLHIARWTESNRSDYLECKNDTIVVDMRRAYRREVGKWMRALNRAKSEVGLEKGAKKCQIVSA